MNQTSNNILLYYVQSAICTEVRKGMGGGGKESVCFIYVTPNLGREREGDRRK